MLPKRKRNTCDEIDDVQIDFYKKKRKVSSVIDEVQMFCRSDFDVGKYTSAHSAGGEEFHILAFWKDHERLYPKMAVAARFILSCPASSASAERSFSQAGWTINVRRTRLAPKNVDALLCIRSFLKQKAWDTLEMDDAVDFLEL